MASDNIGKIYALLDPNTNTIRYVGQTIHTLKLRLKQHINQSSKLKNHLGYWLKNINLNPLIEELECCEYSLLNERELFWINYYKDNNLVNSMIEGLIGGHHTHSEESRKKISEATTARQLGTKLSETTKQRISEAHKGKIQSEETIQKRINTRKEHNGFLVSEETKEKISKSNTGKKRSEETKLLLSLSKKKELYIYNIKTKIEYISCIKDLAEELSVRPNSITSWIKNNNLKQKIRLYRDTFYFSKVESELKVLLKQLEII